MNSVVPSGQELSVVSEPDPSAGDAADTVAVWFDRHAPAIAAYAARRVGPTMARDVTAETFRLALERITTFEAGRGAERPWLFGIATNVVRRHWRVEERRLRAQVRSAHRDVPPMDPLLSVDSSLDARHAVGRVVDLVMQLSPDDRDLLVLIAWERMSSREAASVLGIPAGTARSRLRRIRTHLAERTAHG